MVVDDLGDSIHLDSLAVQVENVCAGRGLVRAGDEGGRRVLYILKVGCATEADVKWDVQNRRLHGFGWIAGQTRIAIDAINGQRSQADAVQSVVRKIDSRITFVGALKDSVVRGRLSRGRFVERGPGVPVPKNSGLTRIDYLSSANRPGRFKEVQSPNHVHKRAGYRIGFTGRDL